MRPCRGTAVASALLLIAALAVAGCGIGPGRGLGEAELSVTRDYGARRVAAPVRDEVTESDTAMRLLERSAKISTRYGGGFVQSIDGIEGAERGGRRYDWFFYVNGVESPVGAAAYALHGGEAVWWDYRDWSAATGVPAVVGSWPQPFAGGYEGRRHPVAVECMGGGSACAEVRERLRAAGATLEPPADGTISRDTEVKSSRRSPTSADGPISGHIGLKSSRRQDWGGAIRVLVGPWARLRRDPAAAQIEAGPQVSGVFAEFARPKRRPSGNPTVGSHGFQLQGLDEGGEPVRAFGPGAGLVAATRRYEAPPVWVVTGAGERGVRAAAGLLDSRDLRDHYAVVAEGGKGEPVPLRSRPRASG
jgi:Domain of unknown function (DUF4430)